MNSVFIDPMVAELVEATSKLSNCNSLLNRGGRQGGVLRHPCSIFLILFSFSLPLGSLFAGSGETGFAFLKIGIGGRAAGMGEAGTATASDATAVFWNPAGLVLSQNHGVIFTYNRWIEGIQHNFAAAKFTKGSHALAIHYISTGVDDIEQRDIPSEKPTAYFSSHDLALGLSYALKLNSQWAVGATGKYVYERIQNSVSAVTFDLGAWYSMDYIKDRPDLTDRWRVGMVLSNVGFSGKFIDKKVDLPSAIRIGSMYDIIRNHSSGSSWSVAVDVVKPFADHTRLHSGTEYGYKEMMFVRAGYQFGYDARGITVGIGMKFRKISLDYGYMPFSNSLGATHRISAAFEFD
jgi:hypothetical protein